MLLTNWLDDLKQYFRQRTRINGRHRRQRSVVRTRVRHPSLLTAGIERLEERRLLSATPLPEVSTDQSDYRAEETVIIVADTFAVGETIEFQVSRVDGVPIVDSAAYEPWQITDGSEFVPDGVVDVEDGGNFDLDGEADGRVQTTWAIGDDESPGTFEIAATGLTSGSVATWQFAGLEDEPVVLSLSSVVTDKDDYLPGETAIISATGFAAGETVEFQVLHIDDTPNTGDGHEPWQVSDGSAEDLDGAINGDIQTTWLVTEDDSLDSIFELTAVGLSSGESVDTHFSDALTTLFFEDFDSGSFIPSNWSYIDAVIDFDDFANNQGPHAATTDGLVELDGNNRELRSKTIDLSNYASGLLTYQVQHTGHEDPPEFGDDLLVQYRTSSGNWATLRTDSISNTTNYTQSNRTVSLPTGAFHSGFQFRFYAPHLDVFPTSGAGADDWFIDVVQLRAEAANRAPVVTASSQLSNQTVTDGSGSHWFTWSSSDPDGNIVNDYAQLQKASSSTGPWSTVRTDSTPGGNTHQYPSDGLGYFSMFAYARDAAGSTDTARSNWIRVIDDDTSGPSITLGGASGTQSQSATQVFTWSVADSQSGLASNNVVITRNGSTIHSTSNPSGSFNFDSYGAGNYAISVTATDGDNDRPDDRSTSTASRTATVLNALPTASNETIAATEDQTYIFAAADFNFSDTDSGDSLQAVDLVTLPTAGTLYLDHNGNNFSDGGGELLSPGDTVAIADINAGRMKFVPQTNAGGSPYDSFQFRVSDGAGSSVATYTMTINVAAVADAPELTVSDAFGDEASLIPLSISSVLGDGDGSEVLSIEISGIPGTAAFTNTAGDTLSVAGGVLTLTPAQLPGLAITMPDDGPVALTVTATSRESSNGSEATTSEALNITVGNVAPTVIVSGAPSVNEAATYTLNLTSDDPGDDTISSWFIDWGDGSDPDAVGGPGEIIAGNPSSATHVYADGTQSHTIVATATDEDGTYEAESLSGTAALDPTFGNGGVTTHDFVDSTSDFIRDSVVVQADGRILVAGRIQGGITRIGMARYNADGTPDLTFGTGGTGITEFDTYQTAESVVIQPDGKILVAGSDGIARFNSDGSLDTSFGIGGLNNTFTGLNKIVLDGDGKIVVSSTFRLARLLADGTVDASFDGDGQQSTSPMRVEDFVIDASGNHIVAGYFHNGTDWDIAVRRYDPLGQLDTGYGIGGTVTFDFGGGTQGDFGRAIALHGDGIVVTGEARSHNGTAWVFFDQVLIRLDAAGQPDTSFGSAGTGIERNGIGSPLAYRTPAVVSVDAQNRILVGSSNTVARYTAGGELDGAFDGDGVRISAGGVQIIEALDVDATGKIVIGGARFNGESGWDFGVTRLNADDGTATNPDDGSLDTTFGVGGSDGNGVVSTDFIGSTSDRARDLVEILPDGKILAVGSASGGTSDILLARYLADGTLDTTFAASDGDGVDGFAITDFGNYESAESLAVDSLGNIYVSYSNVVIRYDSNGILDTGFGTSLGRAFTGLSFISELAVTTNDKVIAAGFRSASTSGVGNLDLAVARLLGDGSLDAAFGTSGIATVDLGTTSTNRSDERTQSMIIDDTGNIVVTGYSTDYDISTGSTIFIDQNVVTARFDANGMLDATFGTGGVVETNLGFNSTGQSLTIDNLDRIVVSTSNRLLRFDDTGSLDPTFDGDGIANTVTNAAYVAVDQDGKIVTAGSDRLARYNEDGTPDTDFAPGGQLDTNLGSFQTLMIDGANRIVAGGQTGTIDSTGANFMVARYITQGLPVTVHNLAPEITALEGPATGVEGTSFAVDVTATDPAGPVADPLTYAWTVTLDGNPYQLASGDSVTINPVDDGTYVATVTVNDGDGGNDVQSHTIVVSNKAPTGTFNAPASVDEGDSLVLSITDPDDASNTDSTVGFEYAFDFGAGYGPWTSNNTATTTANDDAVLTVKGRIRDKDGGETEYTANVTVNNLDPTASDDTADANEDGPAITIDVLENDTDPAGAADPLTVTSVDATGTLGSVSFTAGDVTYDPNRQFANLAAGQTATDSFTYDIHDGDGGIDTGTVVVTVTGKSLVSIDDVAAVSEGTGAGGPTQITYTVSLDNALPDATTGDITVDYVVSGTGATPSNPADFMTSPLSGVATIAAGSTSTTIVLDVNRDSLTEGDETFKVVISNAKFDGSTDTSRVEIDPTAGADTGTGEITDDDTATWSLTGDATVAEGAAATYILALDGTLQNGETATVDLSLSFPTAGPSSDPAETVDFIDAFLTSVNDAVTAYNAAASSGTFTLAGNTLTYTQGANDSAVDSLSIDLPALNDGLVEGDEDYSLTIATPTSTTGADLVLGASTVTTTITSADTGAWSLTGGSTVAEGASAGYTVSLSGTYGAGETTSIDLTFSDVDTTSTDHASFVAAVNTAIGTRTDLTFDGTTLTYTAGDDGDSMADLVISLDATDDSLVEGDEDYTVVLANAASSSGDVTGSGSQSTTISSADTGAWSLTGSSTVSEGSSAGYTVSLSGAYGAGETTSINLTFSDVDTTSTDHASFVAAVNTAIGTRTDLTFDGTTLTYTASDDGDSMADLVISLDATDDSLVEGDEDYTVVLANAASSSGDVSGSGSQTTTITDDDKAVFTINDRIVSESAGTMTFTVSLSNPIEGLDADVDVTYAGVTAAGSAGGAGTDYDNGVDQVTFLAGSTTAQTVTVAITDDLLVEPDETFTAILSTTTDLGTRLSDVSDSGTGTILNDDFLGGRVFDDQDNDGVFEAADGDAGIEGVTMHLVDETSETVVDTDTTDSDGLYDFDVTVEAGTYKIVEVVDELNDLGLLDGRETAGINGGTVDNSQDSNEITGIDVNGNGTADDETVEYLFSEFRAADLFGTVWQDFNNDGEINFGESGIEGVTLTLTGTDDRGNAVSDTDVTASDGSYAWIDLRPGTYSIEQTQPGGFDDGQESLGQVSDPGLPGAVSDPGFIDGNDRFSGIQLVPNSEGDMYNFGERPQAGDSIGGGATATIGFWHNNNGQALINSLNGGPTSTQLGDWLATTFPEIYGPGAFYDAAKGDDQDMNLTGATNQDVADIFRYLHKRNKKTAVAGGPPKVDAQVLAVALATYVTSETLSGGAFAAPYGFNTSADGIGYSTFNVLNILTVQEADDLGLTPFMDAEGNVATIDLLLATNSRAAAGLLYDVNDDESIDAFETHLRTLANLLYTVLNEGSDI